MRAPALISALPFIVVHAAMCCRVFAEVAVVIAVAATVGHDSVINFSPVAVWMANVTGFIDQTGVKAGECKCKHTKPSTH